MLRGLLNKIVGDANEKEVKRLQPVVEQVNALESEFEALADEKLRDKTQEFIGRLHAGETLDDILPEAFAAVREASKRTVNLRHFDVQLIGGALLHEGKVVEMKTGEGKTLVATLPAYLNALVGRGVHVVTVNDYLARRDVQWMGPIYHLLGLRVGLLQQGESNAFLFDPTYKRGKFPYLRPVSRKEAYLADITYGTNNEFGFDYLRDNLATELARRVQRELYYAIVDEVDNVFIDQARTPLIISGYLSREEQEREAEEYRRFANIARKLEPDVHYEVDEKEQSVSLTDAGLAKVEEETGVENIYDEANYRYVHYMEQALKAQVLFLPGRDYIVQHGRVVLIDHFTGRLMPDRRLSEGLHQAIEAKEGVKVMPRTMTHATITIQNYFRLYEKLAGMTGTAATEAEEFYKIYNLDTVVLPTNVEYMASRPDSGLVAARRKENGLEITVYHSRGDPNDVRYFKRVDYPDVIYRTEEAKWQAIIQEIKECYRIGRPVLVGTTSVEKSEALSRRLRAQGIKHQVLYAKNHTQEARIVARAGEPGMITVATQMAGRGVDIKLGGELSDETIARARRVIESKGLDFFRVTPEQFYSAIAEVDPEYIRRREKVLELGGLHIIGTERHEARRIDNQLRGRAGRQGEPGSSRFYLSLEDDLMRRFGGERVKGLMGRLGVEDNVPIEHGLVSKTIENAQTRIEGYNFDIRKHLLEYDDVLNRQRKFIYDQRYRILTRDDLRPDLREMLEKEIDERLAKVSPEADRERELWIFLDQVLPLLILPPDVPFPPPFALTSNWRCFPPYTISFLAERLRGLAPQALGQAVLDISRQASDAYREYLLEKVVSEPIHKVEERRRENLEAYAEFLEQKIDDFVDLAEERGKAVNFRDLLQHLQRTFPLPLEVRHQQLKNRELDEVREILLATLGRSYHQKVCGDLLRWIQTRTPPALRLENVRLADLDSEDVEQLLAQALAGAYDERAEARLAQMAQELERGKHRQAKYNPVKLVEELSKLATFEISSLEPILRQAMTLAYTRWIERQLSEIERGVQEIVNTALDTESRQEIVQLLLNVYYVAIQSFDREHKRRSSFVPRIPLSFLMAASMEGIDRQELRHTILAHLEAVLDEREQLWGEQELQRWGQRRLEDLDEESYQNLLKYLGENRIGAGEDLRIGELDGEVYEALRRYLGIQELEQQRLVDLAADMRDALMDYLGQKLIERVGERRIADLDEETRRWVEEYLHSIGYFEDEDAEQRLFSCRIEDLDKRTFDGIARHLGQERLADCQELPIADLEPDVRQAARDYFQQQGYFTDDKKVQNFLVYQRLSDLDAETRRQACLFLAGERLERVRDRKIERLDLNTRRAVMHYLREAGFFTDETRRQEIARGRLADLDQETLAGFGQYWSQHLFANGQTIAGLEEDARQYVLDCLKQDGYFVDQAAVDSLPQQRLSDLGPEVREEVRQRLVTEVQADLEQHMVGELDQYLQERIWAYLDGVGYFADEAKVEEFRRQPLAQLAPEIIQGLERHLGREWMSTFDDEPFTNLEEELQESILQYLETTGYFADKAAKKRFVRAQTLSELDQGVYMSLAQHLGRDRWSEIKRYRFDELPEEIQRSIWRYLEEIRYFTDRELAEVLPQVKIAALGSETSEALRSRLCQEVEELVAERPIGELPASLQSRIRHYLDERDYFVARSKVEEFARMPASRMEEEVREAVTRYLAQHLLARCDDRPIPDLEGEIQDLLWQYLDQAEYLVDKARQREYAQMRLGDLPPQIYEQIVDHLSRELEQEIGEQRVADLEDNLKRGLQQYLEETGYFVDEERLARLDSQTLAEWRGELDGLALFLGQRQLRGMRGQRLGDLPPATQASILRHVREAGYVRDEKKYQAFQQQTLADLDEEVRTQVFRVLRQEQERAIRDQRIADLDEGTRRSIWQFLEDRGLALDEEQMERLRKRRLTDLDAEVYEGFVRYLGSRQVEAFDAKRISELDEETRQIVRAFLGRRVMHQVQKDVILHFISRLWIDYLTDIEDLRQGIGLQAYGQRDPLVEYKRQAFEMFGELQDNIRRGVVTNVFRWPPRPLKVARAGSSG